MTSWDALKAEGRKFVKLKQYADACRSDSAAIQKCPCFHPSELSTLYCTLSASQLILARVPDAIQSATRAIELDKSNYQGYIGRRDAYSASMALQKAFNDFQTACRMQASGRYNRISLLSSLFLRLSLPGYFPSIYPYIYPPFPRLLTPLSSQLFSLFFASLFPLLFTPLFTLYFPSLYPFIHPLFPFYLPLYLSRCFRVYLPPYFRFYLPFHLFVCLPLCLPLYFPFI
jgi:tetratricopeptide (TPR) repeat protein